jgi:hypothetical protein
MILKSINSPQKRRRLMYEFVIFIKLKLNMNFFREIVSGKKNRFKNNEFNLDLTYITPRIIAMAKPGTGLESLYRN